jgi:NADP-dependent 3-hydroxy acid dehydrogenase YdfG
MTQQLGGSTALITGGGSGLGSATALNTPLIAEMAAESPEMHDSLSTVERS